MAEAMTMIFNGRNQHCLWGIAIPSHQQQKKCKFFWWKKIQPQYTTTTHWTPFRHAHTEKLCRNNLCSTNLCHNKVCSKVYHGLQGSAVCISYEGKGPRINRIIFKTKKERIHLMWNSRPDCWLLRFGCDRLEFLSFVVELLTGSILFLLLF